MNRRLLALTTAALALTGAAGADAHQTSGHGANGRMYIASDRPGSQYNDIWAMNPDGSGAVNLTNSRGQEMLPVVSPDGKRILFTAERSYESQGYDVYVMDADGRNQRNLTSSPGQDSMGVWSPDGKRVAFTSMGPGSQGMDVWVMNADGSGRTNLTNAPSNDQDPAWSPDGTKIAFSSDRGGEGLDIHTMSPDGSNVKNLTPRSPSVDQAPAWSPDGSAIAWQTGAGTEWGHPGIWMMRADGSRKSHVTRTSEQGSHRMPTFSPDGRQIAFESSRLSAAGSSDVFVINTDGTGERNLTHDGSPYVVPHGTGESDNADSPASWDIDRGTPAPPKAPIAFPAKAGDPRQGADLSTYALRSGGRRARVRVDLRGKATNLWPSECRGKATVWVRAGRKTLKRKVLKLAMRDRMCGATMTVKLPKGTRSLKLAAGFKGNASLRAARTTRQMKLA